MTFVPPFLLILPAWFPSAVYGKMGLSHEALPVRGNAYGHIEEKTGKIRET
jgi:hypothetical protein